MSKQPSRDMLIKNLRAMKVPTQLLKFGASGKPKFKDFQLSDDNKYLAWSSQTKAADLTRVALNDIKEVRFGQRTEKFQRNNRKDLEHLSFSVVYYAKPDPTMKNPPAGLVEDSLDLVCKDDKEFDVWAPTLVLISQGKITDDVWAAVQKDLQEQGLQHHRSPTSMMNSPSSAQVEAGVGLPNAFKEPNDMYTFGWSEWGQTANSDNADASTVSQPKLVETLLGKGVVSVACGWSHTSILLETGAVLQVGNRLGTGLAEDFFTPMPTELTDKHSVIAVACGSFHSMALTEKGEVFTWGCNLHGQLGHGDNKDVSAPTAIKSLKDRGLKKIAAGHYTSAAVAEDGTMFTWGFGEHGALGHNDTRDCLEPTIVEDLNGTDIARIAVGGSHMFACTTRETYAWGWNACGQLGLGHEEDQHRPHVVETLRGSQVSAIAAGAAHSIAVVMVAKIGHRVVYTWGSNSCGQLGQDKKAHVNKPTAVSSFNTGFSDAGESASIEIIEVACGDLHTVVRTANGNIYACGSNTYGQLGVGHTNDVPEFKILPSFREKGPRAIACGGEHSCVLTARAWVADHEAKDCMSCKSVFSFVNRKHHCRNCGGVFCGSCTTKRIAILKYGVTEPVRVCDECYKKLGGR